MKQPLTILALLLISGAACAQPTIDSQAMISIADGDPWNIKVRVLAEGDFTLWAYACFRNHEWDVSTYSDRVDIDGEVTENARDTDCKTILRVYVWVYDGDARVGAYWNINMKRRIAELEKYRGRRI